MKQIEHFEKELHNAIMLLLSHNFYFSSNLYYKALRFNIGRFARFPLTSLFLWYVLIQQRILVFLGNRPNFGNKSS